MSVFIVLVTLTLHTPQPIVYIGVHNVIQNEQGSVTKPPQSHVSPSMETTHGQSEVQSTISQYIYSNKFLRRGLVAAKEKTTTQLYKHESTETPDSLHSDIVRRKIPSTAHHVPVTKETPSNVRITKGMSQNERALYALKVSRTAVDVTYAQFHEKKDVLPIVAFFDKRQKYHHDNSTVILVQVIDVNLIRYNRIVGCGIDNTIAKTFRVKPLYVYRNWIRPNFPNLTYTEAMVTCYDLPSSHGSKAFVLYRPYRMAGLWKVYSERPVVVPKDLSLRHPSIVVCSTVYDQPPWISEWLRYQKTIGVDFIHLYAQESFVEQGGMDTPIVKQFIAENRLVVDVRKAYLNSSQIYYYSQPLLYQDCTLRYHGVYDYAMLVDTDDFFIPRIPDQKDIHYYLDLLFKFNKTGTVRLDWIRYFPSCGLTTPPDKILDGNVTDHLSTYKSYYQYVKSIHKLSATQEVAIHEAPHLFPGNIKSDASNSTAYIAHVRKTDGCHVDRLDNNTLQYEENGAY